MNEWLGRNRANLAAFLVVLVTLGAVGLLQTPRRTALQVVSPATPPAPPSIKVHVVGAVPAPGVYQLPADARVEDALKAAGGPCDGVGLDSLNLAAPLRDGQQVVIPAAGDAAANAPLYSPPASLSPGSSPSMSPSAKLDLNSASQSELEALPGIGPVTARKILEYRARNGRFVSIEELRGAKLVNAPTYERVKDLVEIR
ncbi:MAG: helix-hairpin-helix domain-containing protein [Sphingomonadaceae bacterium]